MLTLTSLRGVDDFVGDTSRGRINSKRLIDLALIRLLGTEGRDEINGAIEEDKAVDLSVSRSSSRGILNELAALLLLTETIEDERRDVSLRILVLDTAVDGLKPVDGVLHIYLVCVIIC